MGCPGRNRAAVPRTTRPWCWARRSLRRMPVMDPVECQRLPRTDAKRPGDAPRDCFAASADACEPSSQIVAPKPTRFFEPFFGIMRELSASVLLHSVGSEVLSIVLLRMWENGQAETVSVIGLMMTGR